MPTAVAAEAAAASTAETVAAAAATAPPPVRPRPRRRRSSPSTWSSASTPASRWISTSKWSNVRDALKAFVGNPAYADLGVGLQFFPIRKQCSVADYQTPATAHAPETGAGRWPRARRSSDGRRNADGSPPRGSHEVPRRERQARSQARARPRDGRRPRRYLPLVRGRRAPEHARERSGGRGRCAQG